MRSVGICVPVWRESRYLPLVLEQMELCPGPKIALWQDQPLHWLADDRPAPSGFNSPVKDILPQFPDIEVIKMDHAPVRVAPGQDDDEYGGFTSLGRMGLKLMRDRNIDIMIWIDSDWILELNEMRRLLTLLEESDFAIKFWRMDGRNYWRDFKHSEGGKEPKNIGVAYSTKIENIFKAQCNDPSSQMLDIMCHHPSFALTDEEMFNKLYSFGHAPYYKAREFYQKEWIGRDDSRVQPWAVDWEIPKEIRIRLDRWGCLEKDWI